jgi:uracil-DNA glycosylase family 4
MPRIGTLAAVFSQEKAPVAEANRRLSPNLLAMMITGADCANCTLCAQQVAGRCMLGREPQAWKPGGLMIVGEAPLLKEISDDRPLGGRAGRLMDALLEAAGIEREDVYVTHAAACAPPVGSHGSLQETPDVILACLPRLQWEIQRARPRVILPIGNAALLALTGHRIEKNKVEKFPCSVCGTGDRSKRCVECHGRKTRTRVVQTLETEHKIGWVAGAVFDAGTIAPWLAEAGVRFVVPTFHPSFLLLPAETAAQSSVGGQFVAPSVVAHLKKAHSLCTRERDWSLTVTVTDIPADVAAYTAEPGVYSIDIETDAKEPFEVTTIKCIGLGRVDRAEVLVVDTSAVTDVNDPLILALRTFLEDPTREKILQNRQYDEMVIELRWDCITQGTVFDTMLAHHALCPDEPHNLQRIATTYTETPAWKPPKNKNGMEAFQSDEEFWTYNARDVRNTALSARAMRTELMTERLTQVHAMDLRMSTIAMEMQRCGVPLDQARRVVIGEEHRTKKADALGSMREFLQAWRVPRAEEIKTLLSANDVDSASALQKLLDEGGNPDEFNPESPLQLRWALFDASGPCKLLPTLLTEKSQLPSTSKDALRTHSQHPFVAWLRGYQDSKRIVANYIDSDAFRLGPDGRMHPGWKVHGTRTGRWSSSPNFQNLDELVKTMFVSRPGFVWVGADEAQLELRIIAALSGDETLIRLCLDADEHDKLNPDKDPHSYVSRLAFGRGFLESDEKGRKALRNGTKAVVYGMNYGAGARKIQATIMADEAYTGPPLSVDMVQRIMSAYFAGFPRVQGYRDVAVQRAERDRAVYSPILGRRRPFPLGEVEAPTAMNFPIQSCAADIVDEAMDTLHKALPAVDPDAAILAQVHDALYVECREEHAQAVAKLVEKSMYRKLRIVATAPEMEFVATAKIGPSWSSVS